MGTYLAKAEDIKPDTTSSLKASSGATEGVLDYGVPGKPAYVTWAGLTGREDKRTEGLLSCPDVIEARVSRSFDEMITIDLVESTLTIRLQTCTMLRLSNR